MASVPSSAARTFGKVKEVIGLDTTSDLLLERSRFLFSVPHFLSEYARLERRINPRNAR